MRRKLLIFFATVAGLIVLGKCALVIADTLANEQSKEIEQAKQDFIRRYPKTQNSASTVKLQELTSKLGFLPVAQPESAKQFKISESDAKAFKAIQPELDKYLDAQVARPTNIIDVMPEKLRQFLRKQEATLTAIRKHVLTSESPQWAVDLNWLETGDINYLFPSHSGLINLQKLLLIDALEKNRLGQTKAMLDRIETSWKLNQSLANRPELIGQLINIIILRMQAGTIRKLNNLPAQWQQRLSDRDYRQSVLTALEAEAFYSYTFLKNVKLSRDWQAYQSLSEPPPSHEVAFLSVLQFLSWPMDKVYGHWMAIDSTKVTRSTLAKLPGENVCSFELVDSTKEQVAWWNYLGQIAVPSVPGQWRKAGRIMLELEMTQKILQAKSEAAKTGKWPRSLPNLQSSVCPGFQWIYQVSSDGEMSLSFSPIPQWMQSENQSGKRVELKYRDRSIPRSKS